MCFLFCLVSVVKAGCNDTLRKQTQEGLAKAGLKDIPADMKEIMENVDSDGSGVIDYTEFIAATLDKRTYIQEDLCRGAFGVFDRNGDGKISKDEIKVGLVFRGRRGVIEPE